MREMRKLAETNMRARRPDGMTDLEKADTSAMP